MIRMREKAETDNTGNYDKLFITKLNREVSHQDQDILSGQNVKSELGQTRQKSECTSSAATSSNHVKYMVIGRQERILPDDFIQESQEMAPPQSDCHAKIENGSSHFENSFS